ncbi:MAG: 50S ribosomal protein L32e [Candidatus Aenigmatarchaeota archaeon]|nr:MAG: 50S ribosomal protein L32e [Candidatus Aenigmarchaeota archaeon]
MTLKRLLNIRKKAKRKKPSFSRQEAGRKNLKDSWRRPKGRHSKLRQREKARGSLPDPGYGSPRAVRGLTRSGKREVRVSNPGQLGSIDPEKDAVIISSSVGRLKREKILEAAKKSNITVVNA